MFCNICGSEDDIKIYPGKGWKRLCRSCAHETPIKFSRKHFDELYWVGRPGVDTVPQSTRREFYDDYLCSTLNFKDYVAHTTSKA